MYHQDQIPLPHPGQPSGAEAVLPVSADMPPELVTGKALKQARRQRGLSQIDLAEYMSVSQSRVSAWENGYDEIPYQHRLRLIDLLTNRRGLFDPYIEHLVRTDPNLVINGAPDFKHLHVGSALKPKFYEPDLDPSTWSPHDRPHAGMRHVEFVHLARTAGREISSQLLEMTAERDVPTLNKGALRMRSHQVALQFQDYPKLILSRYDFVKPALGEKPQLYGQLFLEDLDRL